MGVRGSGGEPSHARGPGGAGLPTLPLPDRNFGFGSIDRLPAGGERGISMVRHRHDHDGDLADGDIADRVHDGQFPQVMAIGDVGRQSVKDSIRERAGGLVGEGQQGPEFMMMFGTCESLEAADGSASAVLRVRRVEAEGRLDDLGSESWSRIHARMVRPRMVESGVTS